MGTSRREGGAAPRRSRAAGRRESTDSSIVDGVRVVGLDSTRVTLNVHGIGLTGYQVRNGLLARGPTVELATPDVVLFLVSPRVTDDQIEATCTALREVLPKANRTERSEAFAPPALPDRVLTPRQAALLTARERVRRREAVNRVSAQTIGCYPPGQAIIVAGERVTPSAVDYLWRAVAAGAHLKRAHDDHFQPIEVVRETT